MKLNKWNSCILGDVVKYANSRISVDKLSAENYISTENMLPNRGGIVLASSLPTGNAVKYYKGQTLVSNIRPYFKKIWHAKNDGGCSADVLVFEIINDVDDKFFYYYLSQENFFEYVMAGSKGTKMPRGDKQQILMYPFSYPSEKEQKAIAATLSCLDDKIELNNRMNKNLEEMAQAIFKSWFVDFETFQDGEFEESELGMIPKGWRVGTLGEFIEVVNGYSYKGTDLKKSNDAMLTIKNFDRNKGFKLDGFKELEITERVKDRHFVEEFDVLVACTDLTQNAEIIGNSIILLTKMRYNKVIASMDIVKVKPSNETIDSFFIHSVLNDERFKQYALGFTSGTTVLHLDKKAIGSYLVAVPEDLKLLKEFNETLRSIYMMIRENLNSSLNLLELRDTLLPKLMSGEIRVPIEEVQ